MDCLKKIQGEQRYEFFFAKWDDFCLNLIYTYICNIQYCIYCVLQTHIDKFVRSRIVYGCGSCFIGSMSLERSSSRRRVVILICFVLFIATILLVVIGAYFGKKVETVGIAEKEVGYPDRKIYRV